MIDPDKPVRVFRNWKRDCYTIMQNGRPKASAKEVRLDNVEFLVRPSGRAKMLREKKRNVHAYAVGTLVDFVHPDDDRTISGQIGRKVAYDPYRGDSFVDVESEAPINKASSVHFNEAGAHYLNAG